MSVVFAGWGKRITFAGFFLGEDARYIYLVLSGNPDESILDKNISSGSLENSILDKNTSSGSPENSILAKNILSGSLENSILG
jgi:hypothetical protein